ncbi:hypothetical protein, partial [uncultured Dubosiella sp.]
MNRKDLPTRQTETDQDAPDASRPIYIMVDHAPNPMTGTDPMTETNPMTGTDPMTETNPMT